MPGFKIKAARPCTTSNTWLKLLENTIKYSGFMSYARIRKGTEYAPDLVMLAVA
jgi:hypothetical protein